MHLPAGLSVGRCFAVWTVSFAGRCFVVRAVSGRLRRQARDQ